MAGALLARIVGLVVLLAACLPSAAAINDVHRRVHMRALILATANADDASVMAVKNALTAMGQPLKVVNVLTDLPASGSLELVDPNDAEVGLYNLIVSTTRQLSYEASPGFWAPALSPAQFEELFAYRAKFNVRAINLHSWPHFDGVTPATLADGTKVAVAASDEVARFDNATSIDPAAVAQLQVGMTGSWSTPANVSAASEFTAVAHFYNASAGPNTPAHGVAAAVQQQYGVQTWHFFFTPSNWFSDHVVALGVALQWGLRSLHVGARRLLLSAHVDDVFLTTDEWIAPPEVHGTTYRVSGEDLTAFARFQQRLLGRMPPGSKFVVEMAYNGWGVDNLGGLSQELVKKSIEHVNDYLWISHTYSHQTLDPLSSVDCAQEANSNLLVASQVWGSPTPAAFDATSMVTPAITGLLNADCLSGLHQAGITSVTGDNSRSELLSTVSPYHGIWSSSTTNGGFADMFIIPRFPTNIYYDNVHKDLNAAHFAAIHNLSWSFEEILAYEARVTSRNLLQLRHDPYMFHQANLVRFDTATNETLLGVWLDAVVTEVLQYWRLPILGLPMKDVTSMFLARARQDECTANSDIVLKLTNGVPTAVDATCQDKCSSFVLSGVTPAAAVAATTGTAVASAKEQYGEIVSVTVPLTANTPVEVPTGLVAPDPNTVCAGGCSGHGTCDSPPQCACAPGFTGLACEVMELNLGQNLAPNPSFEFFRETGGVASWFPYRQPAVETSTAEFHHGTRAMVVTHADAQPYGGASVYVPVDPTLVQPIQVSVWSKAVGVAAGAAAEYGYFVDVLYVSGAMQFGMRAEFSPHTAGWHQRTVTIHPTQPVKAVWVYIVFQHHAGTAYFDDVSVRQSLPPGTSPGSDSGSGSGGSGETQCVSCAAGSSGPCRVDGSASCVAYALPDERVCPANTQPCTAWSHLHRAVVTLRLKGVNSVQFEATVRTRLEAALVKLVPTTLAKVKITDVFDVNLGTDDGAVSSSRRRRRVLRGSVAAVVAPPLSPTPPSPLATPRAPAPELQPRRLPMVSRTTTPAQVAEQRRRLAVQDDNSTPAPTPGGQPVLSDYSDLGVEVGVVLLADSASEADTLAQRLKAIIDNGSLAAELGVAVDNADSDGTATPTPQVVANAPAKQGDDNGPLVGADVWVPIAVACAVVAAIAAVALIVRSRRASRDGNRVDALGGSTASVEEFHAVRLGRAKAHGLATHADRGSGESPRSSDRSDDDEGGAWGAMGRPSSAGARSHASRRSMRAASIGRRTSDDDGGGDARGDGSGNVLHGRVMSGASMASAAHNTAQRRRGRSNSGYSSGAESHPFSVRGFNSDSGSGSGSGSDSDDGADEFARPSSRGSSVAGSVAGSLFNAPPQRPRPISGGSQRSGAMARSVVSAASARGRQPASPGAVGDTRSAGGVSASARAAGAAFVQQQSTRNLSGARSVGSPATSQLSSGPRSVSAVGRARGGAGVMTSDGGGFDDGHTFGQRSNPSPSTRQLRAQSASHRRRGDEPGADTSGWLAARAQSVRATSRRELRPTASTSTMRALAAAREYGITVPAASDDSVNAPLEL